jgi:hypothetical protein
MRTVETLSVTIVDALLFVDRTTQQPRAVPLPHGTKYIRNVVAAKKYYPMVSMVINHNRVISRPGAFIR